MIKSTLMFIDGENLTLRYQELIADDCTALPEVIHEPDCYVWSPRLTTWSHLNVVRVSYYGVVVGDEVRRAQIEQSLASITYQCFDGQVLGRASIIPRIYKKSKKSRGRRIVDIQITIDVLHAALTNPVDSILVASGDGDFTPLLKEVQRTGKQVYLAAFSSGLSPKLRANADTFVDLDRLFFEELAESC